MNTSSASVDIFGSPIENNNESNEGNDGGIETYPYATYGGVEDSVVEETINDEASAGLAEKIDACTTGGELLVILKALPKTTGKGGLGLSFNRVIKVLRGEGLPWSDKILVPTEISVYKMGYKHWPEDQKEKLYEVIRKIDKDTSVYPTLWTMLFHAVRECTSGQSAPSTASVASTATPGVPSAAASDNLNSTLNKVALLAEALVHPDSQEHFDYIHTKPEGFLLPSYLDAGPKVVKKELYNSLARLLNSSLRHKLSNNFNEDQVSTAEARVKGNDAWKQIKDVHPEHGQFRDGEELRTMETAYCNLYTILQKSLGDSGSYRAGVGLVMDAYKFSGPPGRTKNIGLFYFWLVFKHAPKGTVPSYATKALVSNIGRDLGAPPAATASSTPSRRLDMSSITPGSAVSSTDIDDDAEGEEESSTSKKTAAGKKQAAKEAKRLAEMQEGMSTVIVKALKTVEDSDSMQNTASQQAMTVYYESKAALARAVTLQTKSNTLLHFRDSAFFSSDDMPAEKRAKVVENLLACVDEALNL